MGNLSLAFLILAIVTFSASNNSLIAKNRGDVFRHRENVASADQNLKEMLVGNVPRTYAVHLPPNFDKNRKLPVVIALHGGGGNAANMEKMSGFSALADRENFVVVYPNGSGGLKNILLTWNAGGCCAFAAENNVDDVGFISALIDKLVADYGVDEKRLYVTGFSNGAMLTYRLAAELSDKLAAAAPVSGAIFDSTKAPSGKVPMLVIHGDADTAVPFDGGYSDRRIVNGAQKQSDKPAKYTVGLWAENNGCGPDPRKTQTGGVIRETYAGCASDNDVELYTIVKGQHAWPGGQKGREQADAPSTEISATEVVWTFFKSHKKG